MDTAAVEAVEWQKFSQVPTATTRPSTQKIMTLNNHPAYGPPLQEFSRGLQDNNGAQNSHKNKMDNNNNIDNNNNHNSDSTFLDPQPAYNPNFVPNLTTTTTSQPHQWSPPPPSSGSIPHHFSMNQNIQNSHQLNNNNVKMTNTTAARIYPSLPPPAVNLSGDRLYPNLMSQPQSFSASKSDLSHPSYSVHPQNPAAQQTSYQNQNGGHHYGQSPLPPGASQSKKLNGLYNGHQQQQGHFHGVGQQLGPQFGNMSLAPGPGAWATDQVDLLVQKDLIPPGGVKPPEIKFQQQFINPVNCSPDLLRCTLTKIPGTKALLRQSRLPLGILVHPFKDLSANDLPTIQCSTIVRCRTCRTYINPFVQFMDQRSWKCNLCSRVNDLPEEFQYDPATSTYGDPSRRPEIRAATVEFLAPADYAVRPPQAAVYLYLLDVSAGAVSTGYLKSVCDILLENLDKIPGDSRAKIGFITYDSTVHFYNLAENLGRPQQMVVFDIDDMFIPYADNLLVSLERNREMIRQFLTQLPSQFRESTDNFSALGAALVAAHQLMGPIGGRITIFQCALPILGPGALKDRATNLKNLKDIPPALNPSTDFYKKLALDASSQFIAVDCFFLNTQYVDIASIGGVAKFSGGCVHHFPAYHASNNPQQSYLFEQTFRRYLTRNIGFEAVMRVRCTKGMSIHTFHGNLFVRTTDLLNLPNCNPDAGFGMQVSIDENLSGLDTACFQAALLYTCTKGERRIRVHTLCLPIVSNVNEVIAGADQQCVMGLVAKMAVDRSLGSSLMDAREAVTNAAADVLIAYKTAEKISPTSLSLMAPTGLKILALYMQGILRSPGFSADLKVPLDERIHFMNQMKVLPLAALLQSFHPDLYSIHTVGNAPLLVDSNGEEMADFPLLHLSSSRIESHGVYLMVTHDLILVYVCGNVSAEFCRQVFNSENYSQVAETMNLPQLENPWSLRIRNFVQKIQTAKPHFVPVRIVREHSRDRQLFLRHLVEDRDGNEVGSSYHEFVQKLKKIVH